MINFEQVNVVWDPDTLFESFQQFILKNSHRFSKSKNKGCFVDTLISSFDTYHVKLTKAYNSYSDF